MVKKNFVQFFLLEIRPMTLIPTRICSAIYNCSTYYISPVILLKNGIFRFLTISENYVEKFSWNLVKKNFVQFFYRKFGPWHKHHSRIYSAINNCSTCYISSVITLKNGIFQNFDHFGELGRKFFFRPKVSKIRPIGHIPV